ncbi:uncharacterized protein LACBIDRAFT_328032 [Laccaria bicolor S238N-H82]|uniref:Predicted protein n=1 Tax=Laccaria bicolor (strain S238N-H82 / ATCC MYA-4686) TaxID=486041 RepID=B0DE85_LACBS|nr:uncharacterized protein LACBIDRAFT_328032 [Laccaria bicolor S238N-H82]EDR07095.1 predicted protein [Laccaria bicolor S238N-H82]|eukprot:XP_001882026.1 predicted protein [Laccaria bicolor S238N-H82]
MVFRDLFSIPPVDEMETYEGVPLVYLMDRSDTLQSLLQLVYNDIDSPFWRLDPCTLRHLHDILELTDKYAIDYLRENIVTQIESCWPRTLRRWDELDPNGLLPEPASAIRLAREHIIPSILPAAFYHLSRISIEGDWRNIRQHGEAVKSVCVADWGLLTADDLRCLLKGRAKMRRASQEILRFGFHREEWPEECSSAKRWRLLGEIEEACIKSPDILHAAKDYIEKEDYGDGVCQPCCSRIRYDLGTFRYTLWTMLSDFFSIHMIRT